MQAMSNWFRSLLPSRAAANKQDAKKRDSQQAQTSASNGTPAYNPNYTHFTP
jgi:hypothetical protein